MLKIFGLILGIKFCRNIHMSKYFHNCFCPRG